MAATDQPYRNQRWLDIVFGVSCLLMLAAVLWMFYDDQYRDWKKEQRQFRNVSEAMAQRAVVGLAPSRSDLRKVDDAQEAVVLAREVVERKKALVRGQTGKIKESKAYFEDRLKALEAQAASLEKKKLEIPGSLDENIGFAKRQVTESDADLKTAESLQTPVDSILAEKAKTDQRFQDIKAELDSKISFYNDAVDRRNRAAKDPDHFIGLELDVRTLKTKINSLTDELVTAQNEVDAINAKLRAAMMPVTIAEKDLSDKEDILKSYAADFDRFHKLAEQKKWGAGDWFRSLPVIDAFASPIKIQQITLDDLTIDYSFKRVTRYDRCTTCHLGIDQPTYTKQALRDLAEEPTPELNKKLSDARRALRQRQAITGNKSFDPDALQLSKVDLTDSQITEYCAHPRLDLFVDGNSPHPSEKFGCTICHAGQGSATSFGKAAHTPNNSEQKALWAKEKDWEHDHNWDYPMLPSRFIESSCVKCHHQITDLIREGSKEEAPKLLRGYNLVRENGCFGCHEIAGIKGGRSIGPDLRLEPTPPVDDYTPAERVKLFSDPLNPPGTMRKVGPSLRRLSEKTNRDWLLKWVKEPRNFRPDTKMPHFFGLSNNSPDVLPEDQKKFPDQEVNSIVHFLMTESDNYLAGKDKFRLGLEDHLKRLQAIPAKERSVKQDQEILEMERRLELAKKPAPLWVKMPDGKEQLYIVDGHGNVINELPKDAPDLANGRKLFSERGCLACHVHEATSKPSGIKGRPGYMPAIENDAHFGPNLTRLALKLGTGTTDEEKKKTARPWLVQWILNPAQYHSRTFMPQVRLDLTGNNDLKGANDVAAWLLEQKAEWPNQPQVTAPDTDTLKKLAGVYLVRSYSPSQVKDLLGKDNGFSSDRLKDMPTDRDEQELAAPLTNDKLMRYVGKKAINQYGCFGCHDIPGFEYAKPIGTPLNDWGKKDAERLAFEDAAAFVRKTHTIVPLRDNPSDPKKADATWRGTKEGDTFKPPYEKFFFELLDHHQREGFLHQKLSEPRSFDFDRLHVWDDRLRMPQFRFSRKVAGPKATADERAAIEREEAEAREAVMTFILGLVAEPVPPKFVANPPTERLAEAQGRKVLDKFNCASCHLVRPGVFDFKTTPELITRLKDTLDGYKGRDSFVTDHFFKDHNAWVGQNPTRPDRLTMFGVYPQKGKNRETGTEELGFRLTHAVRFPVKEAGKTTMEDLPAGSTTTGWGLPTSALIDWSPQYGGTFATQLTYYLAQSNPQENPTDAPPGDTESATPFESQKARPRVPPALIRQGEKTQPLWLYQFLRDPQPIRPMVVLRMPRFNMSEEDARSLVSYFSAADKLSNPNLGLNTPYYGIKEQEESYLADQTARYLARLAKVKEGDKTALDVRLKALVPSWQVQVNYQIIELKAKQKAAEAEIESYKSVESTADKAIEKADEDLKKADEELKQADEDAKKAADEVKKADEELKNAKDDGEKKAAAAKKADAEKQKKAAEDKKKAAEDKKKAADVKKKAAEAQKSDAAANRKKIEDFLEAANKEVKAKEDALKDEQFTALAADWKKSGAYLTDAYRLATNKDTCVKCHQVGAIIPEAAQGPPLHLAEQRLRPEWVQRWVALPERFVTYPAANSSPMPAYFARLKPASMSKPGEAPDLPKYQELFVGDPDDQVKAMRDFLMNYRRAVDMPVNRNRPVLTTGNPGGK